jgi:hypothetical protein
MARPDSRAYWYGVALDALLRLPVHRRGIALARIAQEIRTLDNFTNCTTCLAQDECYIWREIAVVGAAVVY